MKELIPQEPTIEVIGSYENKDYLFFP